MAYSIRVIEDACKPFSNMHSVLHAIKSRFGHSSLSATVQRRKSPCMYSLNALSYWMGSSTTHIAKVQGFQCTCYALLLYLILLTSIPTMQARNALALIFCRYQCRAMNLLQACVCSLVGVLFGDVVYESWAMRDLGCFLQWTMCLI